MSLTLPPKRFLTPAITILVTLWIWVLFDRPYSFPTHIAWNIYTNTPLAPSAFDAFDFPPLSSKDIRAACVGTDWALNSVIATCSLDGDGQGVAEIRNSVLSCVRYCMAAGIGMVLPEIHLGHTPPQRNTSKEELEGPVKMPALETVGLDYMFDLEHFSQSIALSCPQMKLYQSVPVTNSGFMGLDPKAIQLQSGNATFATQWRDGLVRHLARESQMQTATNAPTAQKPLVLELKHILLSWPAISDTPNFTQHFGQILKIRQDMRKLATTVLASLRDKFWLTMDLSLPIFEHAYLGAYLDTQYPGYNASEVDKEYAQYSAQLELYLDQAARMNISLIYLASALGEDIPHFVGDAKAVGITVTTKLDLLKGKDREDVLAMKTEQQMLVDFLVLGRGSGMVGVGTGKAGMVWNIALRRHIYAGPVGEEEDGDGLSWIFGDDGSHEEFVVGMWS